MKFVNQKTCQGLESFLFLDGALVPLKLLPEKLRRLAPAELEEVLEMLKRNGGSVPRP